MEAADGSDWEKWYACTVCGQEFHGKVKLAMAWECWKTYVRLDVEFARVQAMNLLGGALRNDRQGELALSVFQAQLQLSNTWGRDGLATHSSLKQILRVA